MPGVAGPSGAQRPDDEQQVAEHGHHDRHHVQGDPTPPAAKINRLVWEKYLDIKILGFKHILYLKNI